MARGLFSGMLWGGVVSVVVAAVASLMGAEPRLLSSTPPEPAKVEVPDTGFSGDSADTPPQMPAPTDDTNATSMPAVAPTVAPTTGATSAPVADTAPGNQPDAPMVPALETPDIVAPNLPQDTAPEEPVLPSPQAMAPDAPATDAPVAPGVEVPATPAAPVVKITPEPEPAAAPEPEPAPTPQTAETPQTAPLPEPQTEPAVTPDQNAGTAPEAPAPPTGVLTPAPGIGDLAPGVLTNRLPRIGDAPAGAGQVADNGAVPALIANSVAFEPTEDGPLMSVVLIDMGEPRPDAATLKAFPFALTIAIDPVRPDAAEAAAFYRAAGAEVLILTNLPEGSMPADLEVAFQSYLSMIPDAVGVLDVPVSAVQKSRDLAKQLAQILVASGHGLVTFPKGLNSAQQEAKREGVKTALIFRSVDNDKPAPDVLRRALDQAAFRAGQEGGVIVIGHTYPDTITTVLEWGVDERAGGVVMAPVSAVLSTK
ncbi:divergent polysaccharide deacetylase family protein [Pseudogemmobacter sp. W21_MBD1_M6]|uniref:divergent polysaccharide deacetylase family protein n=1 Tax=Pseudogemmobacter sp. W21_MBD1_M6 TaxID=3240271 RepID=UPI003F9A21D7